MDAWMRCMSSNGFNNSGGRVQRSTQFAAAKKVDGAGRGHTVIHIYARYGMVKSLEISIKTHFIFRANKLWVVVLVVKL